MAEEATKYISLALKMIPHILHSHRKMSIFIPFGASQMMSCTLKSL